MNIPASTSNTMAIVPPIAPVKYKTPTSNASSTLTALSSDPTFFFICVGFGLVFYCVIGCMIFLKQFLSIRYDPVNVVSTMLRVLNGIRMAATNGDICAVTEK